MAINVSAKSSLRSVEAVAFRRYYDDLLRTVSSPVQSAEVLLSEGVIGSETKDSITSDKDEDHAKRTLLDAVEDVLVNGGDGEKTLRSLRIAFPNDYFFNDPIDKMEEFIAGECTISLRLAYLRWA